MNIFVETDDFLLKNWVKSLPEELGTDMSDLYKEMEAQESKESKVYKALDNGNKIVVINDVVFKGKRSIAWDDVEKYLKRYVGDIYPIAEDNEIIYIGSELPSEYAGFGGEGVGDGYTLL